MKKGNVVTNLIKNAESLGAVHTHTHTCNFIREKSNARIAFVNNGRKRDLQW